MTYRGKTDEYLSIGTLSGEELGGLLEAVPSALLVLWFTQDHNYLRIDGENYCFNRNELICLTEFHQIEEVDIKEARLIKFNRSFYCIVDHDSEVSCKGLLFFGSKQLPRMDLPAEEIEIFETVYRMFSLEFENTDHLQGEMLQMMLKRFLILCVRLYKKQCRLQADGPKLDLIREYNFLVEKHYREKHSVADYAEMLNRSPKTLANQFKKMSDQSPLEYIQNRRMLEARRLLIRGDLSVKEVAFDLGFEDVQSFSRFFKREEGLSPAAFVRLKGKMVNSWGKMA